MNRPHRSIVLCLALLAGAPAAARAAFVASPFDVPLFKVTASAAADYDHDGDMDFVLAGVQDTGSELVSRTSLFRNDGIAFVEVEAGLTDLAADALAWADYDNDGDLDLLMCGRAELGAGFGFTRLHRNDFGTFVDVGSAGLIDVAQGTVAWADVDNDGDLDVLVAGATPNQLRTTRLYRNDGGTFTDTGAALPGLDFVKASWADCDGDHDLDLALCGSDGASFAALYRNDGGTLHDLGVPLAGAAAIAWTDFDSDGDPDVMLAGWDGSGQSTRMHVNGSGYAATPTGLPASSGGFAWADFDADGDRDVALAGIGSLVPSIARLYRNDAGTLVDDAAGLPDARGPAPIWADFNLDSRLDLLITNADYAGVRKILLNTGPATNTPPSAPTGLNVVTCPFGGIEFQWAAASDAQTPAVALTYNLRVGTTPGGGEIMAANSDPATGRRRLPEAGNVGGNTRWRLQLPPGRYYWSVQAVDGSFAGSPFAPERFEAGVLVDGVRTGHYGLPLATQHVQTAFGNSTLGDVAFANGSELDEASAFLGPCELRLMLAGNLESNFNKLELFFDTKPGGQNRLRGDNAVVDFDGLNRMGDDGSGNGLTFEPGFEADYWISLTGGDVGGGTYRLYANWAELPTGGGGTGRSLGSTAAGANGELTGGDNPDHVLVAIDNSNVGGVNEGTGTSNGSGVPTGLELAIPLSAIGDPSDCFRICAFVNGVQHDFVSNQVLGGLEAPQGFLGEPRAIDFGLLAGLQTFVVCPGAPVDAPPASAAAHGMRLAVGPNPVRSLAWVRFDLPVAGLASVEVFDALGRRVRRLASGVHGAGAHQALWSGADDAGRSLPAGTYFVRLRAPGVEEVRNVTLRR